MVDCLIEYGYLGLFIGAFLAATLIPFSSDVQMVALLSLGAEPVMCVIVATLGNWLGGLSSYYLGYLGKWEWIEKYMKIKRERLIAQQKRVNRYGSALALVSWLPLIGDVIAVALGFYKVKFLPTAGFMLLGKGARFVMWAIIFFYIKPYFL
ncbi:MAG: YqaA family protein [Rikenellaceae bacterium]